MCVCVCLCVKRECVRKLVLRDSLSSAEVQKDCKALQGVAGCCSVLQRAAVCRRTILLRFSPEVVCRGAECCSAGVCVRERQKEKVCVCVGNTCRCNDTTRCLVLELALQLCMCVCVRESVRE